MRRFFDVLLADLAYALLRELGTINEHTKVAVLAADEQLVESLPLEPWDIQADMVLTPSALHEFEVKHQHSGLQNLPAAMADRPDGAPLDATDRPVETLEEAEIELIRRALEQTDGNRTHAAALLGITRRGLIYKIKRFGITAGCDSSDVPDHRPLGIDIDGSDIQLASFAVLGSNGLKHRYVVIFYDQCF